MTYTNKFPTLVVPVPPDLAQEYYLQKSNDWAYEKEWRVVLPINSCSVVLRPRVISSVIFGARADPENFDAVMALLEERKRLGKPSVKVYRAELDDEGFDIRIYNPR
ncbi:DUF2971 domain-containing protein [Diaphorobacter aerolatus]|uniref:Uncharacterized protein n=1 Tax=Diaphorobacter aerolatus TaxID=1288495 RepID=A0A7H0GIN3_9BURK|nr:DUF2971 domain-containing protein [Diaphorobacter aerolatus]QNP48149.1 hypothetical protein H9K75_19235 [Diaphorobacter aerolatus]